MVAMLRFHTERIAVYRLFTFYPLGILGRRSLGFVFSGDIIFSADKIVGQILLSDIMSGIVVRIFVAFEQRALQMHRYLDPQPALNVLVSRRRCTVGRV